MIGSPRPVESKAGRAARSFAKDEPQLWAGMTYREDVPAARSALQGLIAQGVYPERLGE